MRAIFALAILALSWACMGSGVYTCSADDQCSLQGKAGTCEATRYCSFPDRSCNTQRRYGEHADPSVANDCVEAGSSSLASAGSGGGSAAGGGGSGGGAGGGGTGGSAGDNGMCANGPVTCSESGSGSRQVFCSGAPGDYRCNCIDNTQGQVVACCHSTETVCAFSMCCFQ